MRILISLFFVGVFVMACASLERGSDDPVIVDAGVDAYEPGDWLDPIPDASVPDAPDCDPPPQCTCDDDCGKGQKCHDGKCYDRCWCDDDCKKGYRCKFGICKPKH